MYGKPLRDTRLPNGMRVIVHSVPLPDVGIGILIPFGYMNEAKEEFGVTHLLEHAAFRGNEFYTYNVINWLMKKYGEKGRFDAETTAVYALYQARFCKRDFVPAWRLLSSMVFNSTFPAYAIEREKRIVGRELTDLEDDPEFIATRALIQSVYPTHPRRNDFLETPTGTNKLDRARILQRYREFYRPSRALAVLIGDLDVRKVLDVTASLSDVDNGTYELPLYSESKPPKSHDIRIQKDGLKNAFIAFGFRAPSLRDKEFATMQILEYILVHGFDSPLKQYVREQTGCAYHTPDKYDYSHCHGLFYIGASVDPKDIARVAKLICRSIRYIQQSLTKKRFFLNRRALLNDLEMNKGSVTNRIEFLGKQAVLGGPFDAEFIQQIRKVTRDEVVEVARSYLDLNKAVEVIVRPN